MGPNKPDARRADGGRQVQRAGIGADKQRRAARDGGQLAQAGRRAPACAKPAEPADDLLGPAPFLVAGPHDQRSQRVRAVPSVAPRPAKRLGGQSFDGQPAPGLITAKRPSKCQRRQHLARRSPRRPANPPDRTARRVARCPAGRAIPDCDRSRACCVGVTQLVVEPAAQLAAVAAVEADPPPRAGQPCRHRALGQSLQVDGHVEPQSAQLASQRRARAAAT